MHPMRNVVLVAWLAVSASVVPAAEKLEIETRSDVTYANVAGEELKLDLAWPKGLDHAVPAVVVIQEIFGVNKVMRDITDGLAGQGYLAICPDLFWRIEPGIDITDRSDAEWKRAFELSVAGYFKEPSRASRLTPFRVGARAQKAVWESLKGIDLRQRLPEVKAETLILHGRWDPVPLASSETLASLLPNAKLVVFEDSGHALYTEETEKFVQEMNAFLPAVSRQPPAAS